MQYSQEYLIEQERKLLVEVHCDECGCNFQGWRVGEGEEIDELRSYGYDVKVVNLCNECYLKHYDDPLLKDLLTYGPKNEAMFKKMTEPHAFIKIRRNTWLNRLLHRKYKILHYWYIAIEALLAYHQGKQTFRDSRGSLRVVKDIVGKIP